MLGTVYDISNVHTHHVVRIKIQLTDGTDFGRCDHVSLQFSFQWPVEDCKLSI